MNTDTPQWNPVDTADLISVIADKTIFYDDGNWQTFSADGSTLYVDRGHNTYGSWRVEGGVFASVWPPSSFWAEYRVDKSADGSQLRFVSTDGSVFGGKYGEAPQG